MACSFEDISLWYKERDLHRNHPIDTQYIPAIIADAKLSLVADRTCECTPVIITVQPDDSAVRYARDFDEHICDL